MAIENIAGICLDETVVAQFATHPEYLSALVSRFEDQPVRKYLYISTADLDIHS